MMISDEDGFNRDVDCDDLDPLITLMLLITAVMASMTTVMVRQTTRHSPIPQNHLTPTPHSKWRGFIALMTHFVSSYIFPADDLDGFQFWFEDDNLDCVIFSQMTQIILHVKPMLLLVSYSSGSLLAASWRIRLYPLMSQNIPAGSMHIFNGGTGQCGSEDGGTFRFEISSLDGGSCR